MKKIFTSLLLLSLITRIDAQTYQPLTITGFNADVVQQANGRIPQTNTSKNFDGGSPGYVLYERGYAGVTSAPRGLPAGGAFTSAVTSGLPYQLASYSDVNSLQLLNAGTGTLTLVQRAVAKTIFVLASSGGAATTMNVTLNFTDGSTQYAGNLAVADWFNGANAALSGFDRVQRTMTDLQSPENVSGNNPRLYEIAIPLASINQSKILGSVTVQNTGSGVLNVMALSAELTATTLSTTGQVSFENVLQLVTVPASATAQGWGGGGAGGRYSAGPPPNPGGNGGGGGAYAITTINPGDYLISAGYGGTVAYNSTQSTIVTLSGTTVLKAATAGGSAADCVPTTGAVSGANGALNNGADGGAGGNGGGPGGGIGGAGGTNSLAAGAGSAPGGGGGGQGAVGSPGVGGNGRVVITFGSVLPLRWQSLSGTITNEGKAVLQWKVEEQGVASYVVEKAIDGRNFFAIAALSSRGDGTNGYNFTEAMLLQGTAYYRIRQVDRNGRFAYSSIIELSNQDTGALLIYPNPVTNKVMVSVPASLLKTEVILTTIDGKRLQRVQIQSTVFALDLSQQQTGVYLLQFVDGSTEKIIKE